MRSATLERLTVNDLIAKSTAVVHGRVTGSSTVYRGNVIYTDYRINVLDLWKGPTQSSVDVLVPGGVLNGVRQSYPGAPQLAAGQEYVLFLWTSSKGDTFTLGFTQGVFVVQQDASGQATAVRAATTETMLEPGTGRVVKDQPLSMPLAQLASLVSAGAK